jgi:hypothetical protein
MAIHGVCTVSGATPKWAQSNGLQRSLRDSEDNGVIITSSHALDLVGITRFRTESQCRRRTYSRILQLVLQSKDVIKQHPLGLKQLHFVCLNKTDLCCSSMVAKLRLHKFAGLQ